MSKITLSVLFIVIGAIITGMYLEVEYLTGGPGAFIVMALVYSFVVAKREAALMSLALEQRMEQTDVRYCEDVIVPEWQRSAPTAIPAAIPVTPPARTFAS